MSGTRVRFTLTSSGEPSTDAGLEVDEHGAATLWREGGHRVGRFARDLTVDERTALGSALEAARTLGDAGTRPAGVHSTVEQVAADGLSFSLPQGDDPSPPAAPLVALLRALLEDLADHPVAGLELVVTGSPRRATLRHVGPQELTVRLGTLDVRTSAYDADSAVVGGATATVAAGVDGSVRPGWTLDLPVDVAATPGGGFVSVTVGPVEVDVTGDGALWPGELGWSDGWEDE